jgi:hypothetical protein
MSGAAALAAARPEFADAFFTMLGDVTPGRVPLTLPGALKLRFKTDDRLTQVLGAWARGSAKLKAAIDLIERS